MLTAANLLQQAVGLLTHSPLKTLTVVAPALVLMAGVGVFAAVAAPELLITGPSQAHIADLSSGVMTMTVLAAFMVSYAMMAVLWHRHTLAETRNAQPLSARLLLGYLWRVLALAMVQLVVSLALVIPLVLFSRGADGGSGTPALASVLLSTFITQLVLLWLSLRLSLILPAAALGKPIRMTLSWRYTQPIARSLWGVAAALALTNTALTGLVTLLDFASPGHRLAIELPIYVLEGLLIFSVLTTLYSLQTQKAA